jgi:protein involved in polysaccharide export with SLBB domain
MRVRTALFICAFGLAALVLMMVVGKHRTPSAKEVPVDVRDRIRVGAQKVEEQLGLPLHAGDTIRVQVTGIQSPLPFSPFDRVISTNGTIKMPFIGHPIPAAGISSRKLAEAIRTNYVPAFFTSATVKVERVTAVMFK